jgi:hypothetical protein
MLQFNKSEATNKNAVYLDSVNTGSGYYSELVAVYSQSYDNSNGTFQITATNIPNVYRHWLIFENSGSDVPSPSGQYDVSIYTNEFSDAIWGTLSSLWTAESNIWSEVGENVPTELIYSDRAFISGSNEESITQYISSNENGTYTTYNG